MLHGKKIGIILGPGGCTGAITAGMFVELVGLLKERFGIEPWFISGISVGGLVACGYQQLGDLLATWMSLGKKGIFVLFNYFEIPFRLLGTSWFSSRGLERLANRVNVAQLFEIADRTEIEIAARHEDSRRSREARRIQYLSNRGRRTKGGIVRPTAQRWRELLEAGCCIPGILPPKVVGGKAYSDALYPSFGRAFQKGCDIVFFCASDQPPSEKPLSRLLQWLTSRWFMRIRKPFDDTYESLVEHKLRVLVTSKKHPGTKLFALNASVDILDRLQDALTPLTPENLARAQRAVVIVTPSRAIENLNTIFFTAKSIREGIQHGRERMRELFNALGPSTSSPNQ